MCRAQNPAWKPSVPTSPTYTLGRGSVILRAFNSHACHPIHEPAWELVDLAYQMGAQAP